MLFFESRPTPAAKRLIELAIEQMLCSVDLCEAEDWSESVPEVARYFDHASALATLQDLHRASSDSRVYACNDYHWLLLERCLESGVNYWRDEPDAMSELERHIIPTQDAWVRRGRTGRLEIDLDLFLDLYFPDRDYLLDPDVLQRLTPEQKQSLGLRKTTWGVVCGLPPHPDELVLAEVAEEDPWQT